MVCDETCVNGVIPRLDPQVNPIGCYDLKVGYDKTNDTFNGLASLNDLASSLTFSNPYTDQILMDPGYCIKHCVDYNFNYAGLANGTNCYCGKENTLDAYMQVDDAFCNRDCTFTTSNGNVTYKCGGEKAYTVYKAELPSYKPPDITIQKKLNIMSNLGNDPRYKYMGCIKDSQVCGQRQLRNKCNGVDVMTVDNCLNFCRGYNYAGLEAGSQCFCGFDFDSIGRLTSAEYCSASCPGNSSQICGGSWALSVYEVQPKPVPSSAITVTTPSTPNFFLLLIVYVFILNYFFRIVR